MAWTLSTLSQYLWYLSQLWKTKDTIKKKVICIHSGSLPFPRYALLDSSTSICCHWNPSCDLLNICKRWERNLAIVNTTKAHCGFIDRIQGTWANSWIIKMTEMLFSLIEKESCLAALWYLKPKNFYCEAPTLHQIEGSLF